MMSLHCGLHMQGKPGAIVSFSGALLVHKTLPKTTGSTTSGSPSNSSDIAYPPVQLVHGTEDPVVPFVLMQEAQTILEEKGIEVETIARPGLAHGIDPDGLTASIDFLARHLPV
jgi:phospholipase/carboxylesterase